MLASIGFVGRFRFRLWGKWYGPFHWVLGWLHEERGERALAIIKGTLIENRGEGSVNSSFDIDGIGGEVPNGENI